MTKEALSCTQIWTKAICRDQWGPYESAYVVMVRPWVPADVPQNHEIARPVPIQFATLKGLDLCVVLGAFMGQWEPIHHQLLAITPVMWYRRMSPKQRLQAEHRVQLRVWLPFQYPGELAEALLPEEYRDWYEKSDQREKAAVEADNFYRRMYGPPPEMIVEAKVWTKRLREAGVPMPDLPEPQYFPMGAQRG